MTNYKLTCNEKTIDTVEIDTPDLAGQAGKSLDAAFEYFVPEIPDGAYEKMERTEKDGWVAVLENGDIWTVEISLIADIEKTQEAPAPAPTPAPPKREVIK